MCKAWSALWQMTILNGTSFSVPAGSITTVIGPNGAGNPLCSSDLRGC